MRPKPNDVTTVAVVGAGTMGHAIAQVFATSRIEVHLVDIDEEALRSAPARVASNLDTLVEAGMLTADEAALSVARIHPTTKLGDAGSQIDFAVEAASENPAVKQAVFTTLENEVPSDVVIASNTSGLNIYDLLDFVQPDRVVCAHWFAPPHIVPLVEVAGGSETSALAVDWTVDFLEFVGKRPLRMQRFADAFIANRIMMAMADAAEGLIGEGAATLQDIDYALKTSVGVRLGIVGIFQSLDFNGLDLIAEGHEEMGLGVPGYLAEPVAAGHYGPSAGKGFYDYGGRTPEEVIRKRDLAYLAVLSAIESVDGFDPV